MKRILTFAAASLLLISMGACSGNSSSSKSSRSLSDFKNVSLADSMIWAYGQLRAVDYWDYARQDTTKRTEESRKNYMRGIRAGLDAVRANDDAYNQGLYVGVQLAMNLIDFEEEFGRKISRQVLITAIEEGLANDTAVDASLANSEFRNAMEKLTSQKEEADKAKGISALTNLAKEKKLTKVSDLLYAGEVKGTPGQQIKEGETILITVDIETLDGVMIDQRAKPDFVVGEGFPGAITDGLLAMRLGETKTYYTLPPEIFGRYYTRYNLKGDQPVKITITANPSAEPASSNPEPEEL